MAAIGRRIWAIAEGYIPGRSNGPAPEMTSHEAACLLNCGDEDAHVRITLYFTDREPAGPYEVLVPARRTLHLRFNELEHPEPVPRDTLLCQHHRFRPADRGAAHAPRQPPGRERAAVDHRLQPRRDVRSAPHERAHRFHRDPPQRLGATAAPHHSRRRHEFAREVEDHGNAAVVLPYDAVRRTALLVRLLRAPVLMAGGEGLSLEAAAGLIDRGETPSETALREVLEETGLKLGALDHVATVWASPGVSTERMSLFLAEYAPADRVSAGRRAGRGARRHRGGRDAACRAVGDAQPRRDCRPEDAGPAAGAARAPATSCLQRRPERSVPQSKTGERCDGNPAAMEAVWAQIRDQHEAS